MIGTLVYFRDPSKGWLVGKVCDTEQGGRFVWCTELPEGGPRAKVLSSDVAVARPDTLDEVPQDLSDLAALHPGTLVRCVRRRYAAGAAFTRVGPRTLLYVCPARDPRTAQVVASDSARGEAERTQPTLYPPPPAEARALSEGVNKGLREPLGWWTLAKEGFEAAMLEGAASVVCLGETEALGWLHRLKARRVRREQEAAYADTMRLQPHPTGGGRAAAAAAAVGAPQAPPLSDMFDDDVRCETGFAAVASASQRLELSLCRLGGGTWVREGEDPDRPAATTAHLRLASLLADAQALCDVFLAGTTARREADSLGLANNAHPAHAMHCRAVSFSYTDAGLLEGFFLQTFWTGKVAAIAGCTNAFRILANAQGRTRFLGPHTHPDWSSPLPYVSSGEAFTEVCRLMTETLKMSDTDVDAFWGIVAGVMLLQLVRIEEVGERAEVFFGSLDQVAELVAATPTNLREHLRGRGLDNGGIPPGRAALESRRDALCAALYSLAVDHLVSKVNHRSRAGHVGYRHAVTVVTSPGIARPKAQFKGSLGELSHNVCFDALWGLYDTMVFDTALEIAEKEGCPMDPLLTQLRGRSVLDRINPVLRTLQALDVSKGGVCCNEAAEAECTHASGEKLGYELLPPPPPMLEALYHNGVRDTATGGMLQVLIRKRYEGAGESTAAADAISMMSALLTLARGGVGAASAAAAASGQPGAESLPLSSGSRTFWMVTVPCVGGHTGKGALDGLRLESGLYASRTVETALLCKVGHPSRMHLQRFCSCYKSIICPAHIRDLGFTRAARMISEVVFGPASTGWDQMVPGLQPVAPRSAIPPVYVGPHYVLYTTHAHLRLREVRRFTLNKLAVLVQTYARGIAPRRTRAAGLCALTLQRCARARASRMETGVRLRRASLATVAFELECCALRRRRWRAVRGLEDSPLTFGALRRKITADEAGLRAFADSALKEFCETGFTLYDECVEGVQRFVREGEDLGRVAAFRRFLEDEQALRGCILDEQAGFRASLRRCSAPVVLAAAEADVRGAVAAEEVAARGRLLAAYADEKRLALELRESVEFCLLIQSGEFLAGLSEEAALRRIVRHSESRCRDLLLRDFAAGVAAVGRGGSRPLPPPPARPQQQQQQQQRSRLPWPPPPPPPRSPAGALVEEEELRARDGVEDAEAEAWRGGVLRTAVVGAEGAARRRLARREAAEGCRLAVEAAEAARRAELVAEWAAFARAAPGRRTAEAGAAPLERRRRRCVEEVERFEHTHMMQRWAREQEELESFARLAAMGERSARIVRSVGAQQGFLRREQEDVRARMTRRPVLVERAFTPEMFLEGSGGGGPSPAGRCSVSGGGGGGGVTQEYFLRGHSQKPSWSGGGCVSASSVESHFVPPPPLARSGGGGGSGGLDGSRDAGSCDVSLTSSNTTAAVATAAVAVAAPATSAAPVDAARRRVDGGGGGSHGRRSKEYDPHTIPDLFSTELARPQQPPPQPLPPPPSPLPQASDSPALPPGTPEDLHAASSTVHDSLRHLQRMREGRGLPQQQQQRQQPPPQPVQRRVETTGQLQPPPPCVGVRASHSPQPHAAGGAELSSGWHRDEAASPTPAPSLSSYPSAASSASVATPLQKFSFSDVFKNQYVREA